MSHLIADFKDLSNIVCTICLRSVHLGHLLCCRGLNILSFYRYESFPSHRVQTLFFHSSGDLRVRSYDSVLNQRCLEYFSLSSLGMPTQTETR